MTADIAAMCVGVGITLIGASIGYWLTVRFWL